MIFESIVLNLRFLVDSKNKIKFLHNRITTLLLAKQEEIIELIDTPQFEKGVQKAAKDIKKRLPVRIYEGLNVDIFFRTIRKSMFKIDNKPEHIRQLFGDYIKSLNKRLYLTIGNNMLREKNSESEPADGDVDLFEAMEDTQSILSKQGLPEREVFFAD
jgi:hypothetical protein